MSYNGGYNYSPYYQPSGNDGRGQDSYQSSANTTGRYQSSGYGSSNTRSNQQQQPSYTPTTTAADRSAVSYSRYGNTSGPNQYQDMRGGYDFIDRSPVGTTALGNLAHASSLEQDARNSVGTRDNRSLQQIIDYNRSQNRHGNNASPLYGTGTHVNYGHQWSDSRGAASPGVSYTRDPASAENHVSTQNQYPHYGTGAGYSSSTAAYATTQEAPRNVNSYNSYQPTSQEQRPSAYYSQTPRPASGQSYRAGGSNVQTAQGVNQSPTLPANRAPTTSSTSYVPPRTAHTTFRSEQAAPQQRQYVDRRSSGSPTQIPSDQYSNQTPIPTATLPNTHKSHSSATDSTSLQQTSTACPEARASVSSGEQVPTTVDPSHVFNHQEYQRRQAAAASEAAAKKAAEEERARKAAEAEENRKATEAAAALKRVSESQNGTVRETELSKEDQMAAEMRNMIEKMRDYKSKDPSLFSQIWEQVKKTQLAGSVPAAPPLSAKDISSTTGKPSRLSGVKGAFRPSIAPDVDGELPDLGRFPAQRRRRGGKTDSPARKRKSTGKPTDESSPQANGTQSGPPIDPAILEASNHSQQQTTPTPHQSSTTRSANGISASQDRQDIYVKGIGPRLVRPVTSDDSSQPTNALAELPTAISTGPNNRAVDSVQAPVQALNSAGRTNWPEHKKWDLALAAKSILLAMPVNSAKAKSISPEQILAYLNQNPSYEQLCQMIESKGLIIERGHFARCLLEAVPGMGAGGHQPRTALANKQPATYLNTQQLNGSGFGTLAAPVNLKFVNQSQKTISNNAPTAQMTPALSHPSTTQSPPTSEDKPKVHLTKQEMARKRNIVDIVDLSQLSDDDVPPPPKVPRLGEQAEYVHLPASSKEVDSLRGLHQINTPQTIGGPPPYQSPAYYPPAYQPPYSYNPLPPPPNQPSAETSAWQRELINSEDIVQPIDEQKAKKRKRYNPRTIVSDVLIAAGRHPTMEPLNYHLDNLRKTFKHVNDTSDLDTFRWDLVDPGEPPKIAAESTQSFVSRDMGPGVEADGNEADDEDQDVTRNAPQSRTTPAAGPSAAVSVSVEASCKSP